MSEPPNSQPAADTNEPPDLTTVDLEDALRRRTSPRRRAIQIGSAALLIVVVLGVEVYRLTRTPPAPTTPPAVLVSNVSFGTVTLNGKALSGPPPVVLPLRTGVNSITLSALPFAPRSCQLTWGNGVLANIDDCPAEGRDTSVVIGGHSIRPGLIVALTFSDYDLPSLLVVSARQAVSGVLAAGQPGFAVLQPGESVATGGFYPAQLNTDTATTQLRANVSFTLPDQAPAGPFPSTCTGAGNVICAGLPFAALAPAGEWAVTLVAEYQWTVSDWNSNVIATSMPYPLVPPVDMLLAYDQARGWTVIYSPLDAASGSPGTLSAKLCGAGEGVLEANSQVLQGTVTVLQDQGLGGCELLLQAPDGQTARFIWRYGVLLAVGALASQWVPNVPVAPASVAAQYTG